ncbi:hypothetical protein CO151_03910 [bacterium CG_4_9_14_3_um_filter_65_15]|nr:MAG: hypothetical protein CO151_03910 [bacterium CG_4_9_14_3_um_filter_65_15]
MIAGNRTSPVGFVAVLIWGWWLPLITGQGRWADFLVDYPMMTLTMVVGSFIAGATSEGGGAVAFPVLTLVFGVAPAVARDFALLIQAVGMTAASVAMIQPQAWSFWYVCVPVVVVGAPLGAWFIRDRSSAVIRRLLYACIGTQFLGAVIILPFSLKMFTLGCATFATGSTLFIWLGWKGSTRRGRLADTNPGSTLTARRTSASSPP